MTDAGTVLFFINVDWYFRMHWLNRARSLRERQYKVYIVSNFTSDRIKKELTDQGFYLKQIPLDRKTINPFLMLKAIIQFFLIVSSVKPDLIHNVTVKPNIIGGVVARLLSVPVIFSVPGLGTVFSSPGIRCRIAKLVIITLFRLVAVGRYRVVFENEDDRQMFERLKIGDPSSFCVIKGAGVDTDLFAFSPSFPREKKVLFAARLLWSKGLGDLVEASRILKARGEDCTIEVAGICDGDNLQAIDEGQLVRWDKQGLVKWIGRHDDMEKLLSGVSIVVLPTVYGEGVPRILIEAASTGRPLIATDVPGCREIVRHGYNGLLTPCSNPERLADCIGAIINDNEKQKRFGLMGRKMVEEEFAESRVIRETIDMYGKMV